MIQILFFVTIMLIVVAGAVGLRSCDQRHSGPTVSTAAFNAQVAVLGDGTPIFAPNGTITRQLADWLADPGSTQRLFEVGGDQFRGRAVLPTPEARARLMRFATMLKAYPAVDVRIIGFTEPSSDAAADAGLALRRARWVVDELVREGIRKSRLSATAGGSSASGATMPRGARDERVALLLAFPGRAPSDPGHP